MILIATDTTLIANDLPSNQKYNKKNVIPIQGCR